MILSEVVEVNPAASLLPSRFSRLDCFTPAGGQTTSPTPPAGGQNNLSDTPAGDQTACRAVGLWGGRDSNAATYGFGASIAGLDRNVGCTHVWLLSGGASSRYRWTTSRTQREQWSTSAKVAQAGR